MLAMLIQQAVGQVGGNFGGGGAMFTKHDRARISARQVPHGGTLLLRSLLDQIKIGQALRHTQ